MRCAYSRADRDLRKQTLPRHVILETVGSRIAGTDTCKMAGRTPQGRYTLLFLYTLVSRSFFFEERGSAQERKQYPLTRALHSYVHTDGTISKGLKKTINKPFLI